MIEIHPVYSRFLVKFKDGAHFGTKKFTMGTIEEVAASILHYYGKLHDPADCPFCDEPVRRYAQIRRGLLKGAQV